MPKFNVKVDDGRTLHIEADDADGAQATAESFLSQEGGKSQLPDAPVTATGLAKASGQGLREGTEGLAGLPGDAATAGGSLMDNAEAWLVNKITGIDAKKYAAASSKEKGLSSVLPTSKNINDVTSKVVPNYEPQNGAERVTRNVSSFVPAALGGPENIAANVLKRGVVPGLVSEGAGQAAGAIDPSYELPARIAGSLVSPGARQPTNALTSEALRADGGAGSQAVRDMHYYSQGPVVDQYLADSLRRLDQRNLNPTIAPQTNSILRDYMGRHDMSAKDYDELKLRLNDRDAIKPGTSDHAAAVQALEDLDTHLNSLTPAQTRMGNPQAMKQVWDDARGNYAAGSRGLTIDNAIDTALGRAAKNNSGLNVGNDIRNELFPLTKKQNEGARRAGLNDEEQRLLRQITRGTIGSNTLRYISNVLGGGGGIGSLAVGGLLGGTGAAAEGPEGSIAGPLAMLTGLAARKGYNRMQVSRARALSELTRSRAPASIALTASQPANTHIPPSIQRLMTLHQALVNSR